MKVVQCIKTLFISEQVRLVSVKAKRHPPSRDHMLPVGGVQGWGDPLPRRYVRDSKDRPGLQIKPLWNLLLFKELKRLSQVFLCNLPHA